MGTIGGKKITVETPLRYRIRENSWIAKFAAWKLNKPNMAIVLGNSIHLHNCSRTEFLANERWLKHELCHIRQFREHGCVIFLIKYGWESILHGYYNNKYEREAREAETR